MKESSTIYAIKEWDNLGLFKRMGLDKEEFIKTKSDEFYQNRFSQLDEEVANEEDDEKK